MQEIDELARRHGVSVVAYTTDDRIVARQTDRQTDRLIPYSEPVPQVAPRTDSTAPLKFRFVVSPMQKTA